LGKNVFDGVGVLAALVLAPGRLFAQAEKAAALERL